MGAQGAAPEQGSLLIAIPRDVIAQAQLFMAAPEVRGRTGPLGLVVKHKTVPQGLLGRLVLIRAAVAHHMLALAAGAQVVLVAPLARQSILVD